MRVCLLRHIACTVPNRARSNYNFAKATFKLASDQNISFKEAASRLAKSAKQHTTGISATKQSLSTATVVTVTNGCSITSARPTTKEQIYKAIVANNDRRLDGFDTYIDSKLIRSSTWPVVRTRTHIDRGGVNGNSATTTVINSHQRRHQHWRSRTQTDVNNGHPRWSLLVLTVYCRRCRERFTSANNDHNNVSGTYSRIYSHLVSSSNPLF